jgi:hypothetical protein
MLLVMESSLVEASQIYDKLRLKKDFSELKKWPISKDKNKISVWSPPPRDGRRSTSTAPSCPKQAMQESV